MRPILLGRLFGVDLKMWVSSAKASDDNIITIFVTVSLGNSMHTKSTFYSFIQYKYTPQQWQNVSNLEVVDIIQKLTSPLTRC